MLEDSIKWGHANAGKALAKGAGDLKRKGAGKRKCAGVCKRKRGSTDESRASSSRAPTMPSTPESSNNESGGDGEYLDVDSGPSPTSLHQQKSSDDGRVSFRPDGARDKEGAGGGQGVEQEKAAALALQDAEDGASKESGAEPRCVQERDATMMQGVTVQRAEAVAVAGCSSDTRPQTKGRDESGDCNDNRPVESDDAGLSSSHGDHADGNDGRGMGEGVGTGCSVEGGRQVGSAGSFKAHSAPGQQPCASGGKYREGLQGLVTRKCLLCDREGALKDCEGDSDGSDGEDGMIPYTDEEGKSWFVHEECYLFHPIIVEAVQEGDDPREVVSQNEDLLHQAIADARKNRKCRYCRKLGASAEPDAATARDDERCSMHLPCALEHGYATLKQRYGGPWKIFKNGVGSPIERSADPQEASGGADSACPGPVDSPEQSVIDATDESDGDESLGGDDMGLLQEKALPAQEKQGRTMGEGAAPGDTPGEGMNSVGSGAVATHGTGREGRAAGDPVKGSGVGGEGVNGQTGAGGGVAGGSGGGGMQGSSAAGPRVAADEFLKIWFQGPEVGVAQEYIVGLKEPLKDSMEKYCTEKIRQSMEQVLFEFKGGKLDSTDTPEQKGMGNDAIIHVSLSQAIAEIPRISNSMWDTSKLTGSALDRGI